MTSKASNDEKEERKRDRAVERVKTTRDPAVGGGRYKYTATERITSQRRRETHTSYESCGERNQKQSKRIAVGSAEREEEEGGRQRYDAMATDAYDTAIAATHFPSRASPTVHCRTKCEDQYENSFFPFP